MAEFNNSTDRLFAQLGNQQDSGNNKTSAVLQYPSELGNDDQHSWILFEVFDTDSLHFKTTRNNQNVDAALGAMVLGTLLQEGGGAGAIGGAAAKATAAVGIGGNLDDLWGSMNSGVSAEESIYTSPSNTKPSTTIALYMPKVVVNKDGFEYSDVGMGKMRDVNNVITAMGGGGERGSAGSTFGTGIPQLMATKGTQETKMAFELGALEKVSDSAAALRQKAMGATINPRMEMLFKGVNFREFSFEFTFRPKDEQEFESAKQIIKEFRMSAYPELSDGGRFYIFPSEFQITYQFKSNENKYVNKIKRCVCTSIDTNYSDEAWRILPDGRPAAMSISLSFKETKQITRQDVEAGH